jgi:hypothetical protein
VTSDAWVAIILTGCVGLLIGFLIGDTRGTPISVERIEDYIKTYLPTEWAAYSKGRAEGYADGLRDCQGGHE